jgi:hypothetical protein
MEIGRPGLQKGRSNWRSVQETIVAKRLSTCAVQKNARLEEPLIDHGTCSRRNENHGPICCIAVKRLVMRGLNNDPYLAAQREGIFNDRIAAHTRVKSQLPTQAEEVSSNFNCTSNPFGHGCSAISSCINSPVAVGDRGCDGELDPRYVDCALRRWQKVTGHAAVLGEVKAAIARCRSMLRVGQKKRVAS